MPRVLWDPAERAALLGDPDLSRTGCGVVAVGGDGTVGDVINENVSGLPLATLPTGNENLFAKACGYRADPELVAAAVARGQTRRLDLGQAGTRRFSLMVSVGFDADVVHRAARWRRSGRALRPVTRLSYLRPIATALWNHDDASVELDADGMQAHGVQCFVFNLPQYALGLPVAPHASATDQALDWVLLQGSGRARLLRYVHAVFRGRHLGRSDVAHGRATHVRIRSARPRPVQVDGEAWGVTPVEIDILPRALAVFLP
jgi:diacylglycerol kinase family enzyme